MTTPADIKWSAYKSWEGPFFRGSQWLKLVADPSPAFKRVYVSSSSEGGYDSINMYDRCVVSTGINQACEGYHLTSKLLGTIAEADPALLEPLGSVLEASHATFKKVQGRWRFHFLDERGQVDPGAEQQALFLLHSNGKKGSWDDESKAHAKLWAASLANTLAQPAAQEAQIEWAAKRIVLYAMPKAKKILFDDAADEGWVGAMRAAYLSFALNIPATAEKTFLDAHRTAPGKKWSAAWCIHILKGMTFGSGVAIWPHRYEAVRKPLERLYGVDLPDGSKDLAAWKVVHGLVGTDDGDIYDEDPVASGVTPTFTTVPEIQGQLIAMGYDLGPCAADGRMGGKTQDAIITFQRMNKLIADGIPGPQTRKALLKAWRAGVCT